jgi:hypothetical protein
VKARARWPLFLIAAPAAVAIWSGWVGLGGLCGFGPVELLPGVTNWTLNTAITLPVGVEAYAAYALGAWMSPGTHPKARTFARWSALGALAYGMAGQVIYHLLAAAHATSAPWPVVVVVSCMPVAVLGLAAALTHLLRVPVAVPGKAAKRVRLPGVVEIRKRNACGQTAAQIARAEVQLDRRSRVGVATPAVAVPAGDAPPPGRTPAGAQVIASSNGHGDTP